MKSKHIVFSVLINVLIVSAVVSVFYSYTFSGMLITTLIFICALSLVLTGYKNYRIHILILSSFVALFVLALMNESKSRDEQLAKDLKSSVINIKQRDTMSNSSSTYSYENMVQNLDLMIRDKESNQNIVDYITLMHDMVESRLDKNNPKSYADYARVREIQYTLKLSTDDQYVLSAYYEYCALAPSDPECYAMIARFLMTDMTKRDEALKLAKKALELSRNAKEIEGYNSLVEYILKM